MLALRDKDQSCPKECGIEINESCPICKEPVKKISFHNSYDPFSKRTRKRKEFIHAKGSHTVEIKDE